MRPPHGIKVVTSGHAIVAPFCTSQRADLGARGVKIERPALATLHATTTTACRARVAPRVDQPLEGEHHPRLKRPRSLDVVHRSLVGADVFV